MRFLILYLLLLCMPSAQAAQISPAGNINDSACYDARLRIVECGPSRANERERSMNDESADDNSNGFDFATLVDHAGSSVSDAHPCVKGDSGSRDTTANKFFCIVAESVASAASEYGDKGVVSEGASARSELGGVARYSLADRALAQSVKDLKAQLEWEFGGQLSAREPTQAAPPQDKPSRISSASHKPDPLFSWFVDLIDWLKTLVADVVVFLTRLIGKS